MTKETVDKAAKLFTEGYNAREIGDILGYSDTAIAYNLKARFRKGLVSARNDVTEAWRKDHRKMIILAEVMDIKPIAIQTENGTEYAIQTSKGTYSITYDQYVEFKA